MKIGIIGTGYVGLVTACCLAELNHKVLAYNRHLEKIKKLAKGQLLFYEPGLANLLRRNLKKQRLDFSYNFNQLINHSEVIFICVGTPPLKDGSADLSAVTEVAERICETAKKKLIVVNKSTVPVGTGARVEEYFKKSKYHLSVASCPEFLREGKALKDFFQPDRIVVGANSRSVALKIASIFKKIKSPNLITDLATAELIKYASNAFLATKISFINEIANFSEKVQADIDQVAQGMGLDHRINPSFLKAGLGYGGSCFPKDVKALKQMAKGNGYDFKLLKAVIRVNARQRLRVFEKIDNLFKSLAKKKVAVLGLAFKDQTDDLRESAALDIIRNLLRRNAKVKTYDPQAMTKAKKIFKHKITYSPTAEEACRGADLIIIATEWPQFKKLAWPKIRRIIRSPNVIDGKNLLDPQKMLKFKYNYQSIGRRN